MAKLAQKEWLPRRACVASYPTREHKSVLWVWPWEEDCLTVAGDLRAQPEGFLRGVADDASTYTRDLPYGWDTLLENIVDPAHIPFAHHGLQGKRDDAIAINMTSPIPIHAADAADADADGGGGGGGGGGDALAGSAAPSMLVADMPLASRISLRFGVITSAPA